VLGRRNVKHRERERRRRSRYAEGREAGDMEYVYTPHVRLIKEITTGRDFVTNKEGAEDGRKRRRCKERKG
jgi:hypothetical protein